MGVFSALVSAALLAVCFTSASAGSVAISTASGYLYDKSGLSGNVSLPVDGPQNISEIRLEGNEGENFNFSFEPKGDINLVFIPNRNNANESSIVIAGVGELNIFEKGSGNTLFIKQGTKDSRGEAVVIVNENNGATHALLHVNGNLNIEHYANSYLDSAGVIQLWDNTAHTGGNNRDQNNFDAPAVSGRRTGASGRTGRRFANAGLSGRQQLYQRYSAGQNRDRIL